jgi:hypothetical protein
MSHRTLRSGNKQTEGTPPTVTNRLKSSPDVFLPSRISLLLGDRGPPATNDASDSNISSCLVTMVTSCNTMDGYPATKHNTVAATRQVSLHSDCTAGWKTWDKAFRPGVRPTKPPMVHRGWSGQGWPPSTAEVHNSEVHRWVNEKNTVGIGRCIPVRLSRYRLIMSSDSVFRLTGSYVCLDFMLQSFNMIMLKLCQKYLTFVLRRTGSGADI